MFQFYSCLFLEFNLFRFAMINILEFYIICVEYQNIELFRDASTL